MFRNLMTFFKNNLPLIFLCIGLQILLGVVLSRTYMLRHNTIYNTAFWIPTKSNLEMRVMGAQSFASDLQTLAMGHLNLGAWHGFQELLYKDKLKVKDIAFDFNLEPDSYLNVIFNKTDKGFSCVRLSVNSRFNSEYFVVSPVGRFLERMPIDTSTLRARRWHNAKLLFDDDAFSLILDDKEIEHFSEHISREQRVGFRGGFRNAHIDNVLIHQLNSRNLYESFSNDNDAFRITALFLVLVGVVNGLIFLWLKFTSWTKGSRTGPYIAMLNAVFIVISALGFVYLYMTAQYYPLLDESLEKREANWRVSTTADIVDHIRITYGEMPNENIYRILFVGSSQTWGAGASKQSTTFVNIIEDKLNSSQSQEIQFECINAGISSADSSDLLGLYKKEWLKLEPRIVIINLSNNDSDVDIFTSNLQEMIEISVAEGIQPILILEANSVEIVNDILDRNHEAMRRVGATHNVPLIDMHAYLSKKYDEGFLWWDFVHLTDFGQELLAEKLYFELEDGGNLPAH